MSPTMRRASGRSTRSSTRRSSSRMATRVSRGLPLINISRFKACALDPGRPAARRDPIVVPASTHSEPMDGGGVDPIGWTTRSWRTEGAQRGEQSGSPMHSLNLSGLATYVNSPEISSYAACTQRLSVCGGTPDRHVARWGRRSGARPTIQYPPARHSEVVEDYHGTRVPDPYRWLEEPDAPETRAWIEAENRVTESYLAQIPRRATLRQRLTQLWNYPKYGAPFHKAGRFFFFKNDGLQNQSVLYKQASLVADAEVLLDANVLSPDGTVALSTLAVSEDGRLLAYGTSASGSDWEEFHVRDIATARDRSDHLRWIKFSGASWTHDGRGFFYSRYPEAAEQALTSVNRFQKVYYHRLGTDQAQDVLVYERPDQPDWGFGAAVTDDGRYVVLHVWLGPYRRNRVYRPDLKDARHPRVKGEVVRLLDEL